MDELEVADHALLGGRLILREPRRGHRSGTDAVLLAAASRVTTGQHLIDAGAGAGAVALVVLSRVPDATATLIERDPFMAELARHNIQANGFGDRAEVVVADIFDHNSAIRRADVVLSNPPFYLAAEVRASINPQRARSHVLDQGDHGTWFRRLLDFATPKGRIVVVHRPEALPMLIEAGRGRVAFDLRGIHSKAQDPASRIILSAVMGQRTPFSIGVPLVMHDDRNEFTVLAEAIHQGRSWL